MSKRGWLLFAAMSVIWGIPYLLIKVSLRDLTPGTLVFARTAIAAVLLVPLAARRGMLRPLLAKWRIMRFCNPMESTLRPIRCWSRPIARSTPSSVL